MSSRANKTKRLRADRGPEGTNAPQYLRPLDPTVRGYCTAYVDILGTAKALRDLDGAVEAGNAEAVADIVRRTAGSILRFRSTFSDFIKAYDSRAVTSANFGRDLPPAALALWRDFKMPAPVHMHSFSDGLALSVPIHTGNMLATLRGIHMTLYSISAASMVLAIERGQLVRGGVALGYGCTIGGTEVLGAGLAKAAALDKSGKLPRVEIDSSLIELLQNSGPDYADENANGLCALLRDACSQMLVTEDGSYYVNFLANDLLTAVKTLAKLDSPLEHMDAKCSAERDRAIAGAHDVDSQDKIRRKFDWFLARVQEAKLAGTPAASS